MPLSLRSLRTNKLVDFLDAWAIIGGIGRRVHVRHSAAVTSGHTAGHTAGHTSWGTLVHLLKNRVDLLFNLFALALELLLLGILVRLEPLDGLVYDTLDGGLVFRRNLSLHLLVVNSIANVVDIVLESVLGLNLDLHLLVLCLELLSFADHAVNVALAQTVRLVLDLDVSLFALTRLLCGNVEDSVCVDVVGHND